MEFFPNQGPRKGVVLWSEDSHGNAKHGADHTNDEDLGDWRDTPKQLLRAAAPLACDHPDWHSCETDCRRRDWKMSSCGIHSCLAVVGSIRSVRIRISRAVDTIHESSATRQLLCTRERKRRSGRVKIYVCNKDTVSCRVAKGPRGPL